MPALHPYAGGAIGRDHGADYLIEDWDNALLTAAKAMAFCVVDLLADGAGTAREIQAKHHPRMKKQEYLSFLRGLFREQLFQD